MNSISINGKRRSIGGLLCGIAVVVSIGVTIEVRYRSPQSAPIDFFVNPRTFSEVENARAVVDGLSNWSLNEWDKRWVKYVRGNGSANERDLLIKTLIEGCAEFEGTKEEFEFKARLLRLYAHENLTAEWLNTYLDTLYRQPTHPIVSQNALSAAKYALSISRGEELLRALAFCSEVPSRYRAPTESIELAMRALNAKEKCLAYFRTDQNEVAFP